VTMPDKRATGADFSMLSLLYLAAPAFLFCLSFLERPLGFGLAIALGCSLYIVIREKPIASDTHAPPRGACATGAALFASLLVLGITGFFPKGAFAWDWIKHWALLDLLTAKEWPVAVDDLVPGRQWLRFYVGAYLVPAGLASKTSVPVVATTAAWYAAGLFLVFRNLQASSVRESKWPVILVPFVLLLMGGADSSAQRFLRSLLDYDRVPWYSTHSEAWSAVFIGRPLQYSGVLAQLTWVPHQAIASALATLVVLRQLRTQNVGRTALALGLLTLHSPYAAMGLAPFVLGAFIAHRDEVSDTRSLPTIAFLTITGASFAVTVAFFLKGDLPPGALLCFGCLPSSDAVKIFAFLVVELSALSLCLTRDDFRNRSTIIAVGLLCILPFFGGKLADPVMRISMPAILILGIRASNNIVRGSLLGVAARPKFAVRLMALLLMTMTAIGEVGFHANAGADHRRLPVNDYLRAKPFSDYAEKSSYGIREFLDRCGWEFQPQYFSNSKPLFTRARD